jgi:beta-mannosidase
MPSDVQRSPLFRNTLADLCAREAPGVPYWPSTPSGGALPFHGRSGPTHYYGVGAFRRPISDARAATVRFSPECLAFSHLPEAETLERLFGTHAQAIHTARFAARLPRDPGSFVEFGEVVDHYLEELFGVDASELRAFDVERYVALSRIVPGEVMSRVIGILRAPGSPCAGALVWTLRDTWLGGGCGLVDASGLPKAAYHFLRRSFAARALWITDEGLDGLDLQLANDGPTPLSGALQVALVRESGVVVTRGATDLAVAPHGHCTLGVEELLGGFWDPNHAYRFGAPGHDVVSARFVPAGGGSVLRAQYFPRGYGRVVHDDVGLAAAARFVEGGIALELRSTRLAECVAISGRGWSPSDAYFHLLPGETHHVTLSPRAEGSSPPEHIRVSALNSRKTVLVRMGDAGV